MLKVEIFSGHVDVADGVNFGVVEKTDRHKVVQFVISACSASSEVMDVNRLFVANDTRLFPDIGKQHFVDQAVTLSELHGCTRMIRRLLVSTWVPGVGIGRRRLIVSPGNTTPQTAKKLIDDSVVT